MLLGLDYILSFCYCAAIFASLLMCPCDGITETEADLLQHQNTQIGGTGFLNPERGSYGLVRGSEKKTQ